LFAQQPRPRLELELAAAAFDSSGSLRYRDQAERELRKLGHHVHWRTRPGTTDGAGVEPLTERELQAARLVADHKTNPRIAAELSLRQKTAETHLRNIFHKMGVTTRAAPRAPSNTPAQQRARDQDRPARPPGPSGPTAAWMPETESRGVPRGSHTGMVDLRAAADSGIQ